MNRDYGREAQAAAEKHLDACMDAFWREGEGEFEDTIAPFCGCQTCIVREVLHAAWPFLLAAARDEVALQFLRSAKAELEAEE